MINVDELIKSMAEIDRKQNMTSSSKDYEERKFSIAGLPTGNHNLRLLLDKNNVLYYPNKRFHNVPVPGSSNWRKIVCADQDGHDYTNSPCPVCKALGEVYNYNKGVPENLQVPISWDKYSKRSTHLAFCYLINTDAPSEYWQAGNFYIILGSKALTEAVKALFSNVKQTVESSNNPAYYETFSLSADIAPTITASVVRGQGGKVQLMPDYFSKINCNFSAKGFTDADKPDLCKDYMDPDNCDMTALQQGANDLLIYFNDWKMKHGAPQMELNATTQYQQVQPVAQPQPMVQPVQPAPVAQPVQSVQPSESYVAQPVQAAPVQQTPAYTAAPGVIPSGPQVPTGGDELPFA